MQTILPVVNIVPDSAKQQAITWTKVDYDPQITHLFIRLHWYQLNDIKIYHQTEKKPV